MAGITMRRRIPALLAATGLAVLVTTGAAQASAPADHAVSGGAPCTWIAQGATAPAPAADPSGPDGKEHCKVDVGAKIVASSPQTIPTNTTTKITFTQAEFDTDAMFNPVNSTLVVHTPGRYYLQGKLFWGFLPNASAVRELEILVNGVLVSEAEKGADNPNDSTQDTSTIVDLKAGDVIELDAFQNTGSAASSVLFTNGAGGKVFPQLMAERFAP
ncbi:hypothetical protein ACH4E7_02400 [Kitasatospora sp. NPDC018058]|uniref:hypothetical protein n=1 Tax=Kitasatospora sp. NPDC018058 TaxID=3364025 RepID=UPI0037BEE015